jgi:hypothetical protein
MTCIRMGLVAKSGGWSLSALHLPQVDIRFLPPKVVGLLTQYLGF